MSIAIRFLRRRNLGNFEHTELEITDSVESKSDVTTAISEVMSTVKDALYETGNFSRTSVMGTLGTTDTVVVASAPTTVTKAAKTTTSKKVEEPKIETPVTEGVPTQESKPQDAKVAEAPKTDEAPKTEVKKETKKETKIVTKASKATIYDRANESHKNNLGAFLDSKYTREGWKKPENLKKAGEASRALQGTDFLDNEGNVLESFKEAFSKYMVNLV